MEFNKWYYYWFENKGFCPFCGNYMIVSIGCYNEKCPMAKKVAKEDKWIKRIMRNVCGIKWRLRIKKKESYERFKSEGQNLDTSSKKHYLEDDNQGISE